MSKNNKVNRDRYVQGGRLTPDEIARERQKQAESRPSQATARVRTQERPARGGRGASRPRSAPEE
jgi:hypothetical protein